MDIPNDCDRIVREVLKEPDEKKQVVMLLQWLVETAKRGDIYVMPPLDAMLGLTDDAQAK